MPITVPAHQAFVLPLKLRWPRRFDGTALCVASAAPDLGYTLFGEDGHSLVGLVVFVVPFTVAACALLRWRAASGIFANLPDAGPFRVHSYRALVHHRWSWGLTVSSAMVGGVIHVVVDAFTHADRWGSQWLGLDTVLWESSTYAVTAARVLQYLGHVLGSLAAVLMFLHIGRARLMERWYGAEVVDDARSFSLALGDRMGFWLTTLGVTAATVAIALASGRGPVFATILGAALGLLAAGCRTVEPSMPR